VLHINFQVHVKKQTEGIVGLKKISMTDHIIDWPLPNKILGCATDCSYSRTQNFRNVFS